MTYDVQALVELLQRTPMTKAEQLFAGRLIETLMTMIDVPDAPEASGVIPLASGQDVVNAIWNYGF